MDNQIVVELTNKKAIKLLQGMADLKLIKFVKSKSSVKAEKTFAEKYRGIISQKQGEDLMKHVQEMRNEWQAI